MSNTNNINREVEAFITNHAALVAQYRGKYIAMSRGKVIDFDSDEDILRVRVQKQFADTPIFITQVVNRFLQEFVTPTSLWNNIDNMVAAYDNRVVFTTPDGYSVQLSIAGYQFPSWDKIEGDANWLYMRAQVTHPRGNWSKTDPCMMTSDVKILAQWLQDIANKKAVRPHLVFLEPLLQFELIEREDQQYLKISFWVEMRPPWGETDFDHPDYEVYLEFAADKETLLTASENLRHQLAMFPQRTDT